MADEAPETNDKLLLTDVVEPDEAPVETPADDEDIPTFGDEPTEVQETDNATIRLLREELKRARKEAAAARKPAEAEPDEDIGPAPTLSDFDYDEDKHRDAALEWAKRQARAEARKGQSSEAEQARIEATRQRIEKEKRELARADVDDAFDTVRETLSEFQQSLLVATADDGNTAKLIYALAKNPDRLTALAGIADAPRFIKEVAKLEGSLKMVKRKAPISPDTPERGSAKSSVSVGAAEKQLAKLEAGWKGGDRSHIQAFKRQHGLK